MPDMTLTPALKDGDLVKTAKCRHTGMYRCVIGWVDGPVRHDVVTIRILHALRNWSEDGHGRADTEFVSYPNLSSNYTSADLEYVERISQEEMRSMLATARKPAPAASWAGEANALEKAQALGFATIEEAMEHEQWLEKNGSPEFKAWLKQVRQQTAQRKEGGPIWFTNLGVAQWKQLVSGAGLKWDEVALKGWNELSPTQRAALESAAEEWMSQFRAAPSLITLIRSREGVLEFAQVTESANGEYVIKGLPPGIPPMTFELPSDLEEKLVAFQASMRDDPAQGLSA